MSPETVTRTETPVEAQTTMSRTTPTPTPSELTTPPPAVQQPQQPQPPHSVGQAKEASHPYALYTGSYGQPFVPYLEAGVQHGFQQQQLATLQRPAVPQRKSWLITKDVLHVLAIVVSAVGLGLGLSLLSYRFNSDAFVGAVASCPIFGVALVWSVAEEITRWARKWGPGIHPGAHVGVCLILWLCCAIMGGLLAALFAVGFYCDDSDDVYGYYTPCIDPNGMSNRFLGAVVLLLILWLLQFTLFIGACIDTAKRNAAKSQPIMVVAQPPYWGPVPPQGWQQPMNGESTAQQPYPPQQAYYQPPPQSQGAPVQPHITSPPPAAAQGARNGKQPEMAQHSAPADHALQGFYSPAGPSSAA